MVYDEYQVSAEEYFKETEEYMERFWSNNISSYDLKNRFPRVNTGYRDGKSVSEDYQPEAYDLPEGSRFTSHDVAMLGFISCGVIGIDSGEEYDRHKKFQEVMKELGGEEQILKMSQHMLAVGERQMQTDSFFTTESRYITKQGIGMTNAHRYVKEAVCANDLPQIADLCKRGLESVRTHFNLFETRKMVNSYANTYACGEILNLLDRNPDLAEMVGLTLEDRNYYRGMVRLSEIIKEGTIAGDKLAKGENLTAQEKETYEKAYSRYVDLSIMRQAEIDNYKGTKENQELQNAWMNMVMQPETMDVAQKHGIMNSITGTMVTVSHNAWVRDSELIQRLGEADAVKENALFEEMHELVKTGRETGKIPGYENVNNITEIISKTDEEEKKIHDPNRNNLERQNQAKQEREARTRANKEEHIKKLLGGRLEAVKTFPDELQKSIDALESADRWWQRSSQQYKNMQEMVQEMADTMQQFGNPPTYEQLQQMRETSTQLRQSVRDYLAYKQEVHSDTRWERRRIEAAQTLLDLSDRIVKSGDSMELAFAQVPELRDMREQYREAQQKEREIELGLQEKIERGRNPNYDKEKELFQKRQLRNDIVQHTNRRYGKDAPEVYQASGMKMEISSKVERADGAVTETKKEEDALGRLRKIVLRHQEQAVAYVNGIPMKDRNGRILSEEKSNAALHNMVSRMVAVENIVQERILNGFRPGQETVKPGPQEIAFAKNPSAYLKAIEQTQAFKNVMDNMSPEKMRDFILEDGAMEVARSMKEEALQMSQAGNEKEFSRQKNMEQKQAENIVEGFQL